MNLDKIHKLANEQKLDINKPICEKCLVNLTESTDDSGEGLKVYWECPTCHMQWVFECDKEGKVLTTKIIESK